MITDLSVTKPVTWCDRPTYVDVMRPSQSARSVIEAVVEHVRTHTWENLTGHRVSWTSASNREHAVTIDKEMWRIIVKRAGADAPIELWRVALHTMMWDLWALGYVHLRPIRTFDAACELAGFSLRAEVNGRTYNTESHRPLHELEDHASKGHWPRIDHEAYTLAHHFETGVVTLRPFTVKDGSSADPAVWARYPTITCDGCGFTQTIDTGVMRHEPPVYGERLVSDTTSRVSSEAASFLEYVSRRFASEHARCIALEAHRSYHEMLEQIYVGDMWRP